MHYTELYEHVFGEKYQREKYKYEPHNFKGSIVGKPYCIKCGLVALNNKFTQWGIDKGCLNEYHPSFKSQRNKAGEFK